MSAPPDHVRPMLATASATLPADQERWAFEFKWDGIRAVVHWDGRRVRIETRTLRDVTHAYPELHGLGAALGPAPAVLDGEVVALDAAGVPSFQRLQERMHVADPRLAARKAADVPVAWFAFDLLWRDDEDLTSLPWTERRSRLEDLEVSGSGAAVPPGLVGEGDAAFAAAQRRGLEGVVAKRLDSRYLEGGRSTAWLKIKVLEREEFVVGGWLPGEGGRSGRIGSLLVGRPRSDGTLDYHGAVGTGFTAAELERLGARLAPLVRPSPPFATAVPRHRDAVYVEPVVVIDVEYRERTSVGILRHPSYKGERIDKSPADLDT